MLGEPRNGALRRFGPFESPTQVGEDAFEDEQVRPARCEAVVVVHSAFDELEGVLGGRRCGRVGLGRRHQLCDVDSAPGARRAGRRAAVDRSERDDGHAAVSPHTVGRHGVVGEADLGLADLFDQDGALAFGASHGLVDHRLCGSHGLGAQPRAHRPDSARVLSTRTPLTSTEGQPWLTGATWPGWPLPQLNAPPSR